ncbi:MAG: cytochrome c, partial [Chloroflexota bacterium]
MAQTHEQVGRALVMLSVVAAALVVVWLYRWEQKARTAEVVPPPGEGAPAAPLSPQLKAGQQAYMKLCDSCHPGGGAGLGPSVLGLRQAQVTKATREGKGTMPAYTTS